MLQIVIIDDEQDAVEVLSKLLSNFTSVKLKILGTANNLSNGVKLIKETNPDLVFLDIDMPGKNGMAIYEYFKEPKFKVIFVTAYEKYAIDAIKKSAFDYILKPVNIIELQEALKKVSEELVHEQKQQELEDKISMLCTAEIEGKNIILDVENGFIMENTKNIEYCRADQSYSIVVTYVGKEILVTKSLKELQELLPDNQFYRTHKSYLVNVHYIRKFIKTNESYVLLKSGAKIPVSVRTSSVITKDIKKMLSI
jgi:two-component system LytT family response regulator